MDKRTRKQLSMDIINCLTKGTILHGKSYDYEIVKTLGQGSFGITYLASVKMRGELGSIDATVYVAIKEFFMHEINGREGSTVTSGSKTGLCEKYKKKFLGESKNLSKLKNSHIIKVVESFDANETVYYAMEYIDGGSLDELIATSGCISEKQTMELASQIASAMSFMHSKKMLHLDLKPSNVMMRGEDDIVLIDFGLSKQFDENGIPESSTTIGGGTPGYSPIEQSNYNGDASNGLPVTMDIYALGATMFKMLTGHKPPVASDLLNDGFPSNELQIKGISQETIAILEHSMQPQRGKRIQSMPEFKRLIDESLNSLDEKTVIDENVKSNANKDKRKAKLESEKESIILKTKVKYNKTREDVEVVYGGPIPKTKVNIFTLLVWITTLAGLILWMIDDWSERLSRDVPVFYFWLADCIVITVFAWIGILRSDLFRKNRWLWLGLFLPSLLNPLIWDPNWYIEWVVEIAAFAPIFIYASRFNNIIIKLIMLMFIAAAFLMIFGF